MADDPKPGTPGGVRWNYDGWDVAYVDGKYIDPHAEKDTQPGTKPAKPETRFGKRGVTDGGEKKTAGNGPQKSGSDIVREVRARLKQGKHNP